MSMTARCPVCERECRTEGGDADLCPRCEARERAEYAAAYADDVEIPERPWSKAAMRERLGISGDRDE